jgi:hypothetical protein
VEENQAELRQEEVVPDKAEVVEEEDQVEIL